MPKDQDKFVPRFRIVSYSDEAMAELMQQYCMFEPNPENVFDIGGNTVPGKARTDCAWTARASKNAHISSEDILLLSCQQGIVGSCLAYESPIVRKPYDMGPFKKAKEFNFLKRTVYNLDMCPPIALQALIHCMPRTKKQDMSPTKKLLSMYVRYMNLPAAGNDSYSESSRFNTFCNAVVAEIAVRATAYPSIVPSEQSRAPRVVHKELVKQRKITEYIFGTTLIACTPFALTEKIVESQDLSVM